MCGIVGYIGKQKVIPILFNGLNALEYRGYDSAGIAYVTDKINIEKEKGRLDNLIKKVDQTIDSTLGIGHTRWATHGKPNNVNAHPHKQGSITLVHNGIIENYEELKLLLKDYNFKSETDTEVLAALIDKLYQEKKDIKCVLKKCSELIRGSYAIAIIVDDDFNHLYATRKDSPLIIATSKTGNFIASDVPAILKYTNQYMLLDNYDIAVISKDKIDVFNRKLELITKKVLTFEGSYEAACKNGYKHFMLKEIFEEPYVFKKTVEPYIEFGLDSLNKLPNLNKYTKLEIIGCGSAYHAGLIGKNLIEKFGNIPVEVYIASEYRYNKIFHSENTLAIFISQSGETADTLACLRKAKEENISTLGIINVVDSSIAREVDQVIYTKAGCEIAVATTKAYMAQVSLLTLMALNLNKDINVIKEIRTLPKLMDEVLNYDYEELAKKIYNEENIFFIGRSTDYSLCLEGSLKLKEVSYIHSDAYPAGELKHGTISLINNNTYVIAISTLEKLNEKMISNIKEVKARGAKVIYITTDKLNIEDNFYDEKIVIPTTLEILQPIITVIPLQLLAYYVAELRNCDIDKPKNLAKSVTVE